MPINQCFKKAAGQLAPGQAMAMKAEDNLLRIAATLTLWNDHSAGAINSESVESAAHLMDYYLTEGLRIADFSSELSDDSDLSMAADLLKWAKVNGFYLVYSRMLTRCAPRRAMRTVKTIEKLMHTLVEHGQAVRLEDKPIIEGKPRKKAWLITS